MKKIKGIIFDLDGTIANTLPLCIKSFRNSIEPLIRRSLSDDEIIGTFGPSEEGTILALAPDHYKKGVSDYLSYYSINHDMCPHVFAGIKELLAILKKNSVRIAMVTGKGEHSTEISLQHFDIKNVFEFIETGSKAGPRKASCIQAVLNNWPELIKDEVFYVGDAPSDIEASRQTGIPVIAAAWAETTEPEKLLALNPDKIFYNIPDFTDWLESHI